MPAKIIVISSSARGAGKTHFAAALSCWLTDSGQRCAPLHLSPPEGDPVACPEGGTISRAGALLAEACGLMPEPLYESGWAAIEGLRQQFDTVLVEAPAGAAVSGDWPVLRLARESGRIHPGGLASLTEFQPGLMPGYTADIAALPLWSVTTAPRCGVISLPHIDNFADYQLLRGSEWLTLPGVGRYANLFLPLSTNIDSDLEWLEQTGLATWIVGQRAAGAKLNACGWDYPGAERCERGDPLDFRYLSAQLGRRVPPPLPDEATRDRLAAWCRGWTALDEFSRIYL